MLIFRSIDLENDCAISVSLGEDAYQSVAEEGGSQAEGADFRRREEGRRSEWLP